MNPVKQLQKQSISTSYPIRELQSQLEQISKLYTELYEQIIQTTLPLRYIQNHIAEMVKPLTLLSEQYKAMNLGFSPQTLKTIQYQLDNLSRISAIAPNIFPDHISPEASIDFTTNALDIMSELESDDSPQEIAESKESVTEILEMKSTLSWEQVILIIGFIIEIVAFLQSQAPNIQLNNVEQTQRNIEKSLQKLIDIETEQLNLLEQVFIQQS